MPLRNPDSFVSRRRLRCRRGDRGRLLRGCRSARGGGIGNGFGGQFAGLTFFVFDRRSHDRDPHRLCADRHCVRGNVGFTFEGLPAGGEKITATLSFPGALTGSSFGIASLEDGSQTEFNDHSELMASTGAFFNTTTPPSSIPLSFEVANGSPIIVFAELLGEVDGVSGVADFGDPPMLTLTLPNGASVTTASGVFDNLVSATVPEPSTWAMMLIGFGGLNFAAYRARRSIASEVAGLGANPDTHDRS